MMDFVRGSTLTILPWVVAIALARYLGEGALWTVGIGVLLTGVFFITWVVGRALHTAVS